MELYDLHVRLKYPQEPKKLKIIINVAQALGYAGIAVDSLNNPSKKEHEAGFSLIRRKTMSLRNATRLRLRAEKIRRQTDLLVIHGRTKPIWLAAATVPAVDMVMLSNLDDFGVVDSQVARAMAAAQKPIEVCLHGLLIEKGPMRSRLMRAMRSALQFLVRARCQLVLTSGAPTACFLRSPRDLAALSYLANIPEDIAIAGVLHNPTNLVTPLLQNEQLQRRRS